MKNAPDLARRAVTGILGLILLTAVLMKGGALGAFFFVFVISAGMFREYLGVILTLPDRVQKMSFGLLCFLSLQSFFFMFHFQGYESPRLVIMTLVLMLLAVFIYFLFSVGTKRANDRVHAIEFLAFWFGIFYLIFVPQFLVATRMLGLDWIFYVLFTVWAADTGAYFVGKAVGKRKLYKAVSPKKTIEGTIGGILFSVGFSSAFAFYAMPEVELSRLVFLGFFLAVFSQVGDLCVSLLKRAFEVKDFGGLLPGHGGFLDRFDGVVFTAPVAFYAIQIWF